MDSTKEKVSYCIGLETGKNLKMQFSDIDLPLLLQGFQDAVSDSDPKLKEDEVMQIMQALRTQIEMQQREFLARLSADNKKSGEEFLSQNKKQAGVVTLSSGLQYKVLSSGSGVSPKPFDAVTAHYKGSFIDGRVFDSSYERGQPHQFFVNRVIPGWSEALQLMKEGDKWELFIPSYLAYGEAGFGNHIGPNVTLVFEIELVKVN